MSTLHVTITLEEIKRQIVDMAAEVAQAVNKGNRLLRNWNNVRMTVPQSLLSTADEVIE